VDSESGLIDPGCRSEATLQSVHGRVDRGGTTHISTAGTANGVIGGCQLINTMNLIGLGIGMAGRKNGRSRMMDFERGGVWVWE
jgi:hypothetical protein